MNARRHHGTPRWFAITLATALSYAGCGDSASNSLPTGSQAGGGAAGSGEGGSGVAGSGQAGTSSNPQTGTAGRAGGSGGSTASDAGRGAAPGGMSGRTGNSGGSGGRASAGTGGTAGGAAGSGGRAAGGTGGMPGGTAGSAGMPAANGGDRCDVAVQSPGVQPMALTLSGSLGTHDPAIIEQDGTFYTLQTGPRLPAKKSTDLMRWTDAGNALGNQNPAWVSQRVQGATDLWAPDLSHFGDQYHVYYSASTFGSNHSCIGHATRASMATGNWMDRGPVICSNDGRSDNWNAIDPNVIVDQAGTAYLVFGSFWSGIKAIQLDANGARANDMLHSLASRNGGAIEAPFIVRRCGYYYLFVSFDKCCAGADSTYNIRVGRSREVLGPYVDKQGTAMMNGGGTLLVQGKDRWRGPGHNAVLFTASKAYNVYHSYDANNGGRSMLRISELVWDADGWPVSGGP